MNPVVDKRVDTIVIGGSAGSLNSLKIILSQLPPDLPAAIYVCQHVAVTMQSQNAEILSDFSTLPVVVAEDEMAMRNGHVYVAPPDVHMMLGRHHIHLRRGAHENNFRPAIDPLFRSAAIYAATSAVGVVLSGLLDDGASGARAIERTGGRILVQSPDDCDYPDMPLAAIAATRHATSLPLEEIAPAIVELAGTRCPTPKAIPVELGIEVKVAGLEEASMSNEDRLGELSPFNCPHCNGVLWEIEDGPMTRYRCHTGHAYTMTALANSQEEALDRSLFDALRNHKGRVELLRRMVDRTGEGITKTTMEKRIALLSEDATRIEKIIAHRRMTEK